MPIGSSKSNRIIRFYGGTIIERFLGIGDSFVLFKNLLTRKCIGINLELALLSRDIQI